MSERAVRLLCVYDEVVGGDEVSLIGLEAVASAVDAEYAPLLEACKALHHQWWTDGNALRMNIVPVLEAYRNLCAARKEEP